MSSEEALRQVIETIQASFREQRFEGLEDCFHEQAVITGPGYIEMGRGRERCAQSYREFATQASIVEYKESGQNLRLWESSAIYTFDWEMTWQRNEGPKRDAGTDLFVFQQCNGHWQLIFRQIQFSGQG